MSAYVAGSLSRGSGVHRIALDLLRSDIGDMAASFLCRIVESWCHQQCLGDWSVTKNDRSFSVEFDNDRDCVLFTLTREFTYISDHMSGPRVLV
jgi:hypothetical protein